MPFAALKAKWTLMRNMLPTVLKSCKRRPLECEVNEVWTFFGLLPIWLNSCLWSIVLCSHHIHTATICHHPTFSIPFLLTILRWPFFCCFHFVALLHTVSVLRQQMASCKTNARIDKLRDASAASSKSFGSVLEGLLRRSRLWTCGAQTSSTCAWLGWSCAKSSGPTMTASSQRRCNTVNYRFQVPEAEAKERKESSASASCCLCRLADFCLELELSPAKTSAPPHLHYPAQQVRRATDKDFRNSETRNVGTGGDPDRHQRFVFQEEEQNPLKSAIGFISGVSCQRVEEVKCPACVFECWPISSPIWHEWCGFTSPSFQWAHPLSLSHFFPELFLRLWALFCPYWIRNQKLTLMTGEYLCISLHWESLGTAKYFSVNLPTLAIGLRNSHYSDCAFGDLKRS